MFATSLWPFSLVFFADILQDPLIQALIIFFVADTIKLQRNNFLYTLRLLIISALLFFTTRVWNSSYNNFNSFLHI